MTTLYWVYDTTHENTNPRSHIAGNWVGRGEAPGGGWTDVAPDTLAETPDLYRYNVAQRAAPDGIDQFIVTGLGGGYEGTRFIYAGHKMILSRDLNLHVARAVNLRDTHIQYFDSESQGRVVAILIGCAKRNNVRAYCSEDIHSVSRVYCILSY